MIEFVIEEDDLNELCLAKDLVTTLYEFAIQSRGQLCLDSTALTTTLWIIKDKLDFVEKQAKQA